MFRVEFIDKQTNRQVSVENIITFRENKKLLGVYSAT